MTTNEKYLTTQGYSELKNTALVDMRTMINETTEKGKKKIGQAIATAKETVIKNLNTEYEAILKELSVYDITKGDL